MKVFSTSQQRRRRAADAPDGRHGDTPSERSRALRKSHETSSIGTKSASHIRPAERTSCIISRSVQNTTRTKTDHIWFSVTSQTQLLAHISLQARIGQSNRTTQYVNVRCNNMTVGNKSFVGFTAKVPFSAKDQTHKASRFDPSHRQPSLILIVENCMRRRAWASANRRF